MVDHTDLFHCIDQLQEWIVESEMQGSIDVSDPFYPAYEQLDILRQKLEQEHEDKTSS